jgi:hypothetical protein
MAELSLSEGHSTQIIAVSMIALSKRAEVETLPGSSEAQNWLYK